MIIIRQKGSNGRLANIVNFPEDKFYFTNSVFNAKTVEIIFFDKTIQHVMYMGGKSDVFRHIATLEDKDAPFIILLDKKCKIKFSPVAPSTVINAECLDRATLECSVAKEAEKSNKSDMFNVLFQDYMRANSNLSFKKNFAYFMMSAAQAELYLKALVFIAMSHVDGEILNSNKLIGETLNDDKVWFYKEDVIYTEPKKIDMVEMVEMSSTDKLADFSAIYEAGKYIDWNIISKYSEDELVLLICKYPTLFSDFMVRGWSRYDAPYYGADDDTDDETGGRFNVDDEGIIEYKEEGNVLEKYYEDNYNCEPGTSLCYICDNYFDDCNMVTMSVTVEKSQSVPVKACMDCKNI